MGTEKVLAAKQEWRCYLSVVAEYPFVGMTACPFTTIDELILFKHLEEDHGRPADKIEIAYREIYLKE